MLNPINNQYLPNVSNYTYGNSATLWPNTLSGQASQATSQSNFAASLLGGTLQTISKVLEGLLNLASTLVSSLFGGQNQNVANSYQNLAGSIVPGQTQPSIGNLIDTGVSGVTASLSDFMKTGITSLFGDITSFLNPAKNIFSPKGITSIVKALF